MMMARFNGEEVHRPSFYNDNNSATYPPLLPQIHPPYWKQPLPLAGGIAIPPETEECRPPPSPRLPRSHHRFPRIILRMGFRL